MTMDAVTTGIDLYGAIRQRALVVGTARSGLAAARLLRQHGVAVVLNDAQPLERLSAEAAEVAALPGVTGRFGEQGVGLVGDPRDPDDRLDLVVLSPGVPRSLPLVAAAEERGIPVIGEVELAWHFLDGPLLGITGSNGKSTTTALAGEIMRGTGRRVAVAGNIGTPLAAAAGTADVYVVELSSFQLESLRDFRARVACLLNVTPDHMDRYPSFEAYRAAKLEIFRNQTADDFAVVNADDPLVANAVVAAHRLAFSRLGKVDEGMFLASDGRLVARLGGHERAIVAASELRLVGSHNIENALAAGLAALALGAADDVVAAGLARFAGLPHRCEAVAEIAGVTYFNDSKGTNVGATLASLAGFPDGRVWLLLGGRDKGSDFAPLAELAAQKAARVLTIGEAAEKIEHALAAEPRLANRVERAGSVREAVRRARHGACPGEVVLLSPACASFDQYRNFEERGDDFRACVLAEAANV